MNIKNLGILLLIIALFVVWYIEKNKMLDRALVANVYGATIPLRTKVIDYYYEYDEFPGSNASLGLPEPELFREKGLRSLAVEPKGVIHLEFFSGEPGETRDVYIKANQYQGKYTRGWRCLSPNIPDINQWMASCEFHPE